MNELNQNYDELKQKFDELSKKEQKVIDEIKLLQSKGIVKRYLGLIEENEEIQEKLEYLYRDLKVVEYATCDHVLITSKTDYDEYEGRTHKWCGCIKCGLDTSVLRSNSDYLSSNEHIMYSYLRKNVPSQELNGINTNITCDINLAQRIYSRIKEVYPEIDDETAIYFLKSALENIRNIKVNDERKVSRAKRLSLKPNFNKWDKEDIYGR